MRVGSLLTFMAKRRNIKLITAGLLGLLAAEYVAAAAIYAISENSRDIWDGMWWAFMTFTTVGYGDQFPVSSVGRIAGMVLVSTAVFIVMPSITALVTTKLHGEDYDKFTHEEQEEVKYLLREIHKSTRKVGAREYAGK